MTENETSLSHSQGPASVQSDIEFYSLDVSPKQQQQKIEENY